MALTAVQKGLIGETEASKILMMSSHGNLEVDVPASDDERRDREVHERGHFGVSVALQVKIVMHLARKGGVRRAEIIHIQFSVDKDRVVSHPLFWYLLAYLNPKTMTFEEPFFLVDSKSLHRLCYKKDLGRKLRFDFQASVSPTSSDEWTSFRVGRGELGKRVLEILRNAETSAVAINLPKQVTKVPGVLSIGIRRSKQERTAA